MTELFELNIGDMLIIDHKDLQETDIWSHHIGLIISMSEGKHDIKVVWCKVFLDDTHSIRKNIWPVNELKGQIKNKYMKYYPI